MSWQPLERSTPYVDGKPVDLEDEEQWANDQYVVNVRRLEHEDPDTPPAFHLSIRRQDREAVHDWRHFQRIKNQLAGPEYEGIEIYPAESRLVDAANQYHLWCFPHRLPFGFDRRLVQNQYQGELMGIHGHRQRDFEKVDLEHGGLTKMKDALEAVDKDYAEKFGLNVDKFKEDE